MPKEEMKKEANEVTEVHIPEHDLDFILTKNHVTGSSMLFPQQILEVLHPDQFEMLVEIWAGEELKEKFHSVRRCGGAGDMGRDVIGYINESKDKWVNYQCKHYNHKLAPGDVWLELGKTIYYTYKGFFNKPEKYYFVTAKGIGPNLNKLFEKPEKLKDGLIDNWDKKCKKSITTKIDVILDSDFLSYIETFDFSIFDAIGNQEFITSIERNPKLCAYLGLGLNLKRKIPAKPPKDIENYEINYTKKIFDAYNDAEKLDDSEKISEKNIEKYGLYNSHFNMQRVFYFKASTLLDLERDKRIDNEKFVTSLKESVFNSVSSKWYKEYENGFQRMNEVTDRARLVSFNTHPLKSVIEEDDAHGICHHITNSEKIGWVKNYE